MKFPILSSLLYAVMALATSEFRLPENGTQLTIGEDFIVQVMQHKSGQSVPPIGVAIGILPCRYGEIVNKTNCGSNDPTSYFGLDLLYHGEFHPEWLRPYNLPPYDNITVKIPDYYSSEDHGQGWEGKAELNVAIAYTTGVFHQPYIEMLDTLTIDMV